MGYDFDRRQDESAFARLKRISIDKVNGLHKMDWLDVKDEFGFAQSAETLRKHAAGWKMDDDFRLIEEAEAAEANPEINNYTETTEIMKDGSQKSDKLIKMSTENSKDPKYLLEAHGFSHTEWELISARNNIWNVNSTLQGVQTLFSSKISVKPRTNGFDMDKLLEEVSKSVEPLRFEAPIRDNNRLLEIPLYDMHFGVASFAYYEEVYHKIAEVINSTVWQKVLFVVGQDLFHNDGFTGKTTSGTLIEQVNTETAWADAYKFYQGLISIALNSAEEVDVIYSNGNHDQSISYGFTKTLEARFPDAYFETSMRQRKGYTWENIFLGFTHGDKGVARIAKNFISEHGKAIASASVVEIHSGHLHHEKLKDDFGVMVRTLASSAVTDGWHEDNGFVGAMKRFQLFEFTPDSLETIYYI